MKTAKVKEITGLTDRQLDYLIKKVDVLKREKAQGKARDFSFREVVYLKLASIMRSDGLRLDAINNAIETVDADWINDDNPAEAGSLLWAYDDPVFWIDKHGPNKNSKTFDAEIEYIDRQIEAFQKVINELIKQDQDNRVPVHVPKYFYNVASIAREIAKLDQLELDLELEGAVH